MRKKPCAVRNATAETGKNLYIGLTTIGNVVMHPKYTQPIRCAYSALHCIFSSEWDALPLLPSQRISFPPGTSSSTFCTGK